MHSRIYQISSKPRVEWIKASRYDEHWFTREVADYVSNHTNRDDDIEWIKKSLNGIAEIEGNKLVITDKRKFFERKYKKFTEAVKRLSKATLDEFIARDFDNFEWFVTIMEDSLNEKFAFYVDDGDEDGISTFDEWMSAAEEGKTYYLGSTLDYHF